MPPVVPPPEVVGTIGEFPFALEAPEDALKGLKRRLQNTLWDRLDVQRDVFPPRLWEQFQADNPVAAAKVRVAAERRSIPEVDMTRLEDPDVRARIVALLQTKRYDDETDDDVRALEKFLGAVYDAVEAVAPSKVIEHVLPGGARVVTFRPRAFPTVCVVARPLDAEKGTFTVLGRVADEAQWAELETFLFRVVVAMGRNSCLWKAEGRVRRTLSCGLDASLTQPQ